MTDLATLGIAVESSQAARAADDLSKLSNSAKGAEQSVGKFGKGVTGASSATAQLRREILGADSVFGALSKSVISTVGAFAGIAAGTLAFRQFIDNTIEAEEAQAQLAAAIKSTGGAAGYTVGQLQGMASGLQSITTYGDEAIQGAEALLLTFKDIRGDQFKDATAAILDMSTAMNQDLKSSAIQVGKALNNPVEGLTALQRVGVSFSSTQKELITRLAQTGQVAQAQAIILRELQSEFGGSAVAARDTLGGALKSLGNAWGDLFEMSGGVSAQLRESIESVIRTISDPAFKDAIQTIGTSLFAALNHAADGAIGLANEINRTSTALDQFNANPNLDNFLNVIGMKLVEGGAADQARDFVVSFSRSAETIRAEIAKTEQAAANMKDIGFGDDDPFAGQAVDRLTEELVILRKELTGVENDSRSAFAEMARSAENASMVALGAFNKNGASSTNDALRRSAVDVKALFEDVDASVGRTASNIGNASGRIAQSLGGIAISMQDSSIAELQAFNATQDAIAKTSDELKKYQNIIQAGLNLNVRDVLGDVSDLKASTAAFERAEDALSKLFEAFHNGNAGTTQQFLQSVGLIRDGLKKIAGEGDAVDPFIDGMLRALGVSEQLIEKLKRLREAQSAVAVGSGVRTVDQNTGVGVTRFGGEGRDNTGVIRAIENGVGVTRYGLDSAVGATDRVRSGIDALNKDTGGYIGGLGNRLGNSLDSGFADLGSALGQLKAGDNVTTSGSVRDSLLPGSYSPGLANEIRNNHSTFGSWAGRQYTMGVGGGGSNSELSGLLDPYGAMAMRNAATNAGSITDNSGGGTANINVSVTVKPVLEGTRLSPQSTAEIKQAASAGANAALRQFYGR